MAPVDASESSGCPGCSGPTLGPGLCAECLDAFRLAWATRPSALGYDGRASDDMDLWDAWALVGDVGGRSGRAGSD